MKADASRAASPDVTASVAAEETPLVDRAPKRNALVAEGNVVACACIFASAVAFDALNALPTTIVADVPTSLRATALVLVAMVAAPPVEPHYLFEQRALAFVLLVAAAWVGLHHGGPHARVADALYCLLGGWATVLLYGVSGPAQGERGHDGRGRRENVVALAAAFLGYAGLRAARAGVSHATEVARFTMSDDDVSTRGYAVADDVVASSLVFGGLICVSAAVIVLINHDVIYEHGCAPVCSIMAMLSVLVFTSAFLMQVVAYARMEELSAIFDPGSCEGAREVCTMTFRARRMHAANASPATLWACAVGLTIFAFPHERRCRTRRDYYLPEQLLDDRDAARAAGWVALLSAGVAVLTVAVFANRDSALASVELLLLYFSVPVAWFGDTWIACGLHVAGIVVYAAARLGSPFGFDLTYLTHWFVLATLVLTLVLGLSTGITQILYSSVCSQERYVGWIEHVSAMCMVMLVSVQLSLTLGSLAVVSGYDGSAIADTRPWRVWSFEWAVQHCVSFFFVAAVVGGRYECQSPVIRRCVLQLMWFLTPFLLSVAWGVSMAVVGGGMPYTATGDPASIIIALLAAIVPWTVVGVVVC